jgi:hypothetical protein
MAKWALTARIVGDFFDWDVHMSSSCKILPTTGCISMVRIDIQTGTICNGGRFRTPSTEADWNTLGVSVWIRKICNCIGLRVLGFLRNTKSNCGMLYAWDGICSLVTSPSISNRYWFPGKVMSTRLQKWNPIHPVHLRWQICHVWILSYWSWSLQR